MTGQPDHDTPLRWDPDYVVKPGATLQEHMEIHGMSATVMARACGRLSVEQVVGILDGSRSITAQIAADLALGTGISAQFWLNLELNYRKGLAAGKRDSE